MIHMLSSNPSIIRPYDHAYHTRYHMPHVISPALPFDDIIEAHSHQQQWHMKSRGYDNNNNNNNSYNYNHNRDNHGQRPIFSGGAGAGGVGEWGAMYFHLSNGLNIKY